MLVLLNALSNLVIALLSEFSYTFTLLQFFLNGEELSLNSVNSGNPINHGSMNWVQDLVSYMSPAGAVVAS